MIAELKKWIIAEQDRIDKKPAQCEEYQTGFDQGAIITLDDVLDKIKRLEESNEYRRT